MTARQIWRKKRGHILKEAILWDYGPQDPWVWEMLFWWATPDIWDDKIDTDEL